LWMFGTRVATVSDKRTARLRLDQFCFLTWFKSSVMWHFIIRWLVCDVLGHHLQRQAVEEWQPLFFSDCFMLKMET
jgi:hypothetical protein